MTQARAGQFLEDLAMTHPKVRETLPALEEQAAALVKQWDREFWEHLEEFKREMDDNANLKAVRTNHKRGGSIYPA